MHFKILLLAFVSVLLSFVTPSTHGSFRASRPQAVRFAHTEHLVVSSQNSAPFRSNISAKAKTNQPIELGKVTWLRHMDEAVAKSEKEAKPILILFQEVPGCMTCQRYGTLTLSHPLIVEAIETHFIPLAIYNNKKGHDAEILKYYNEPSWNNPVVRVVNADRSNLTQRLASDYSPAGLVSTMLAAFRQMNQTPPKYLQLLQEELQAETQGTEEATFSMFCFWTGEKELGQLDGVVSTEAGFMNGKEVVQVKYNPNQIAFDQLLAKAESSQCASNVYTNDTKQKNIASTQLGKDKVSGISNFRPDREPKYYLGKTIYQYLPMTELQSARANALIGSGQSPDEVLSPRQLELLKQIEKRPKQKMKSMIGENMLDKWVW